MFFSTFNTFSQKKYKPKVVTNELYVEFVDTIEYLQLRVDFDSLNKINKVSVIEELTTLKDTSKIELYINKIESLKVKTNISKRIPPTIFSYRFINKEFKDYRLTPNEKKLITKYFKNGTYKYNRPWLKTTTKREDNKQYAIENDFIDEYDLEWYDDHRYTITLVKTNDPNLTHKIGEKSYIEIICIINSNNYMFRSSRDGKNFTEIFTKID